MMALGVSAGRPTPSRHLSGTLLDLDRELWLIDCGEATQFQLQRAAASEQRLTGIAITHLHGDHVLGLPGLLSSMSMNGRRRPLHLIGPTGISEFFDFIQRMPFGRIVYDVWITEIDVAELDPADPTPLTTNEPTRLSIEVAPLVHRVPCIGYRFTKVRTRPRIDADRAAEFGISGSQFREIIEAGRLIIEGRTVTLDEITAAPKPSPTAVILGDTRPCDAAIALSREASVLQHEATFVDAHQHLAVEYGHSTAREAAEIARAADVQYLRLTHFSTRYSTTDELVAEAAAVLPNTDAARELEWWSPQ